MKKIAFTLIGISMAAGVAQAQDVGPPAPPAQTTAPAPPTTTGELPGDPLDAAPPAPSALPAEEPALPPEAAPPAPEAPAPDADASAMAFSDAEIDAFAKATVDIQDISADATLDADTKQQQMVEAVTGAGLEPDTYNSIGEAISTDQELRAKVQTAMAKHSSPGEG